MASVKETAASAAAAAAVAGVAVAAAARLHRRLAAAEVAPFFPRVLYRFAPRRGSNVSSWVPRAILLFEETRDLSG